MEQLLSGDDDSSDIFSEDVSRSYYTQLGSKSGGGMEANRRVISAYERSEGEIGRPTSVDDNTSQGEVRFPGNPTWMASGPLSGT